MSLKESDEEYISKLETVILDREEQDEDSLGMRQGCHFCMSGTRNSEWSIVHDVDCIILEIRRRRPPYVR